jgi:tripartite-type tricarboxylate transporter receptor subunit TctC
MVEQGFAEIALQEWLGWFLPARTSPDVVRRLNDLVREGLQAPELVATLANGSLQPRYTTPEEFAVVLKQDYERWAPIVQATGFSATD